VDAPATPTRPAPATPRRGRVRRRETGVRTVVLVLVPLVGLAVLLALVLSGDPLSGFRSGPPIEEATVERVVLRPGEVSLQVRNAGPDPVTVAQVLVNDAFWAFELADPTLGRLEGGTITIPYPWEEGTPVQVTLLTATGATIEHTIEAASETPANDGGVLARYLLLGLLIGPLPVAVGLAAKPALQHAGATVLRVVWATTLGLLVFLLVDTVAEGLSQAALAGALDGLGLLLLGAGGSVALLIALSNGQRTGLAMLIAVGIGLHNLGEGLAVGAALAAGSLALGATLVAGFVLHNTTEGLAIATPLVRPGQRAGLARLALLVVVAGGPAMVGTVLGGYATTPAWAALAFGAAAGALGQVTWLVGRELAHDRDQVGSAEGLGFVGGLAALYLTGLLAG
jgi:zinc transporter, ZIP family